MFDAVRSNQKIVQIILALIILPFAFWGVESYIRNVGGSDGIATVGGSKISPVEYRRALQEQQERLRKQLGGEADEATLNSPALREAVLEETIGRRLLALYAGRMHLGISDQQLVQFIASSPALQENGKFSPERYEQALANQGKNKVAFEAELRQSLAAQQVQMAVGDGALPGETAVAAWLGAVLEQREVSESVLTADRYLDKVKVTPEAIRTYYDGNLKKFEVPEQVRVEYLVLDQSDERRASHILVKVAKGASPEQVKAAEAKAEDILGKAKKSPGDFAKLARQFSEDPGSAGNGGDLDWFGRGMMTKPFETAAFSIRDGIVPQLVRSDYGFHIIKVTGARPDRVPGDGQASPAELADRFAEAVYNKHPDGLQAVADEFKLPLQQSGWLARGGHGSGSLASPKLMAAIFSEDAIKSGHNTEAMEVSPNVMVSARVVEHKAAAVQPLEVVSPTIERLLAHQEAAKLAAKDGEERLARLTKGETTDSSWNTARLVSRAQPGNLPAEAVKAVFAAAVGKLPAYTGIEAPGGYVIFRISQVKPYVADPATQQEVQALRNHYWRVVAEEELFSWQEGLKDRFPVNIDPKALESAK